MGRDLKTLLKLRVPMIVRLGHRRLPLSHILRLAPGAIIELPQLSDEPLDLMVNNKVVGNGTAVKIGENFGLRVTQIGDPRDRLAALAPGSSAAAGHTDADTEQSEAPPAPVAE